MEITLFWLFASLLLVLAALFVLAPLWLKTRGGDFEARELRKNANIALFQERKNELEAELVAGTLEQDQFESLLLELQQSLLADVHADNAQQAEESTKNQSASNNDNSKTRSSLVSRGLPIALVILIPIIAFGMYQKWGSLEDVGLMDLYQRTVNNVDDPQEAQNLIVELGTIVRAQDDKPWAWYFLAENFASLGLFTEAEIAYQQSAQRMEDSPEKALVLGRVALAKYINADLQMTDEIRQVIDTTRAINPNEISVLQLLAADAEQTQDYSAAIQYWRLLIQSNPNSEQARALRMNIAAAQELLAGEAPDAAAGPVVEVQLSLADGVELDGNLRVFIAARNAEREGMPPLAATVLTVGELPTSIRLDNSSAVGAFNLASAETIYVSALVSSSGSANPQSGDYRVVSENFAHNGQHAVIELVLSQRVP